MTGTTCLGLSMSYVGVRLPCKGLSRVPAQDCWLTWWGDCAARQNFNVVRMFGFPVQRGFNLQTSAGVYNEQVCPPSTPVERYNPDMPPESSRNCVTSSRAADLLGHAVRTSVHQPVCCQMGTVVADSAEAHGKQKCINHDVQCSGCAGVQGFRHHHCRGGQAKHPPGDCAHQQLELQPSADRLEVSPLSLQIPTCLNVRQTAGRMLHVKPPNS